jgi:alanine-glyoxylate transaminase/serine-glyoxylate transaminase/serine-pyruvate transaminase
MAYQPGRHFLQIPGPTNVPDRVLRAIDQPTIDHRSREFSDLALSCIAGMRTCLSDKGPGTDLSGSGTGAWEAALVNTLSPGDRVLASETGHFSTLWTKVARNLSLTIDYLPGDWRHGADAAAIGETLAAGSRPRDQSRDGGPQRDFHWRRQRRTVGAARAG